MERDKAVLLSGGIAATGIVGAIVVLLVVRAQNVRSADSAACQHALDRGRLALPRDADVDDYLGKKREQLRVALEAAEEAAKSCEDARREEVDALRTEAKRKSDEIAAAKAKRDAKEQADKELAARKRIATLTVAQAAREAAPQMSDSLDKPSQGAITFAAWAALYMTWRSLQEVEETTHGKVMKDPDAERGKRVCMQGRVVQIARDGAVFRGVFDDYLGNKVISFIAVGSSGALVDGSPGRFCGVATERHTYSRAYGGVINSALVVGMFDLTENRKK